MSVSHPLLKELKGCILKLREDSDEFGITDNHFSLLLLCEILESIFREGFKGYTATAFGMVKRDYWSWIHYLFEHKDRFNLLYSLTDAIEYVKTNKKVSTLIGKGRLFIRITLLRHLLDVLISAFSEDEVFIFSMYDPKTSVLGNEILLEIFSSLIHEINKINFKLDLNNASFLDETWILGLYQEHEFVPCKEMGITYAYFKGRTIVVRVKEGSIAAEEDRVMPGDVLDELYGKSLYQCNRSLISSLFRQHQGLPVHISIIKAVNSNNDIYPPIKALADKLGILETIEKKLLSSGKQKVKGKNTVENVSNGLSTTMVFHLLLLARFLIKKDGRVSQIEKAISRALGLNTVAKEVTMEISETKLKVIEKESNKHILTKHFTEISACGRKQTIPNVFAIIFGETTCTIAEEFQCHVMKAKTGEEVKHILSSVAQGFGRTHWEV